MKHEIEGLITDALENLAHNGLLSLDRVPTVSAEPPRSAAHGDFSSNIAMTLAKPCRRPPIEIAKLIVAHIAPSNAVEKIEIAPPGFINFYIATSATLNAIQQVLAQGDHYGHSEHGASHKVQIEFVSANPTGPLHVGHGRGAAYGAVLANLLAAVGYSVSREYYVNDAGRQMDILALSVWLRYLQNQGLEVTLPANAYQGDYVSTIAADLASAQGDRYLPTVKGFERSQEDTDPELALDTAIAEMRETLGADDYALVHTFACEAMLAEIKADLCAFGVVYDVWFSERALLDEGDLKQALSVLRERDYLYAQDGTEWFRSTAFEDEKDRVVIRANGVPTYFATDIAYHQNKYARGFDRLINIWGADHHGYIPRVRAAVAALGKDAEQLDILLVQFAALFRHGKKVQMSTRAGEFVTLRELIEEVGRDAARFYYITRRADQHLDFDLDLATAESKDNLVYYIQYAHARICSVFAEVERRNLAVTTDLADTELAPLVEPEEHALARLLRRFPDTVANAATLYEPHLIANYLRDLASDFHAYYNTHKLLVNDESLRVARLALAAAVRTVIANGLTLLGVSAPLEM